MQSVHLLLVLITFPKFHRKPFSIRAKQKNADIGTGQTSGQRDVVKNIIASASHSLAEA